MIVFIAGVIGGVLGYSTAKKRNGNGLDMAQYAVGYAIAFMVLGLIIMAIVQRVLA